MSDRASRRRMSRFIDDEAQVSGSAEWSYGDDEDGASVHQLLTRISLRMKMKQGKFQGKVQNTEQNRPISSLISQFLSMYPYLYTHSFFLSILAN
jgi:hypothetical protein